MKLDLGSAILVRYQCAVDTVFVDGPCLNNLIAGVRGDGADVGQGEAFLPITFSSISFQTLNEAWRLTVILFERSPSA